jgi:ATP-dependent phosphofructokinase / diphosphate-dependent phosphofructokinase
VVSEGATFPDKRMMVVEEQVDPFGHVRLGGIGNLVAHMIEAKTGFETRCVVLGHLQRGGPPSAYDRVLATRMGLAAAQLVLEQRFGTLVALSGNKIIDKTLGEGGAPSTLDLTYYHEAAEFFQ